MTRAVASFVTWLSVVAVLVVAGGYTVTYLFQWQWMRAQIAGIAFVAALVVASTLAILARIRRLERRLDLLTTLTLARTADPADPAAPGDPPDVEPRPDFPWLAPATSAPALLALPLLGLARPEDSVFIPVFLATGLVVAALASVVERISALRHGNPGPVVEHPAAAAPSPSPVARAPGSRVHQHPGYPFVLVPVVAAAVVAAVVAGLWRTAHYRSEPLGPGITTLTVEVSRSTAGISGVPELPEETPAEAVEAVGRFCGLNAGIDVRYVGVAPGPAGTTLLRLSPLLDEAAQQRYAGCLEDAVLDRHVLDVVATDLAPD
jgi:hypothetical protein